MKLADMKALRDALIDAVAAAEANGRSDDDEAGDLMVSTLSAQAHSALDELDAAIKAARGG